MQVWMESKDLSAVHHQLFDCRNVMDDIEQSTALFNKGHIDGAVFVSGFPVLYNQNRPEEGRHPLPELSLFYTFVNYHTNGRTAVCYDQSEGFMATRFFFLCYLAGLPCLILKENYNQLELPKTVSELSPVHYLASISELPRIQPDHINKELLASRQEVRNSRQTNDILIDARAEQRYLGEVEPIDARPGRIPGAVNFPYQNVLNSGGDFSELQHMVKDNPAIVYCGSGLSATPLFAALTSLNHPVKLYAGSYSEWLFHYPDDIERG
ncbi:sulfurtransferase [Macrococcus lamae]|uniref:Rhodanese domain-containing protein n=1 Tax=Macrococcus lamae TaxID=198484 RepID=A0A4V3BFA2_9STAP|nr:rhodanese-like domain-containing protein [Macrococcus lamae]TDM13246.1 hypothetical protein ERX29_01195 [Macrococcus lamae]